MVEGLLLMGCPRLAQRDEQSTLAHVFDISDMLIHRVPSSMLLFGPITILTSADIPIWQHWAKTN